jgi:hypothetical protein
MHKHLEYSGGLDEVYLCIKWDETSYDPVFFDYKHLNSIEVNNGGNEFVTI